MLTIARTAAFKSMDPPQVFSLVDDEVQRQVYSTLLTYAYLDRPYRLEPELLESMPTWDAGKLTYTFHLRRGVHFHDDACFPGGKGREMVADDVLYSLKRYADARLNSQSWFAMEGSVVGLDAYRAATAKAAPQVDLTRSDVTGLRRIDDHTFTIRLTRENPLFLFSLTMMPTAIVPIEAVQMYKDGFGVHPVGTGPFSLAGPVDRQATLHFVRNPAYYGLYPSIGAPGDLEKGLLADAGGKLPRVDAIDMPLVTESQQAGLRFMRGELDYQALDRGNLPEAVIGSPDGSFHLADKYASDFNISWSGGTDTDFIVLNMKDPLIGRSKLLRQAMAHAIDPQALIDALYGGRKRRLESMVPYDMPGSERETGAVNAAHNLALARKLVADAGYPDGKGLPPISISFASDDTDTHQLFDLLRTQFAAAGIPLKGDFRGSRAVAAAKDRGHFQLKYGGWSEDYPDPENFFQLLYGKNAAPGSNAGSYVNPAYDKAYEAMRLMGNGPARLALIRTMNGIIKDDVPVLLLSEKLQFAMLQKWVGNFKSGLIPYEYMYLSVDTAARRQGLQRQRDSR